MDLGTGGYHYNDLWNIWNMVLMIVTKMLTIKSIDLLSRNKFLTFKLK